MNLVRLVLLALACVPVFVGFALPFLVPDKIGILGGLLLVALGAILVWLIETRTRRALDANSWLSRILNTDG